MDSTLSFHAVTFLGGDLYHENKPSRETQLRVTRLFRRYCLNDRPVALKFLSDPATNFSHSQFPNVNYEDCNINVGLPVFSIHGNHDDLTGKGLSALDVLHESGLINLFGKFEEIDKFVVSPVLLKKGTTNVALYGIGSQRDDRLCRAFKEEKIRFLRPKAEKDSWFNILVLHQNRSRRCHDRSTGAYLPESLIPTFFDLVIWGHEHECKIEPQYYESGIDVCGDGFYIIQPGSTIATSLCPEEAAPKHVVILSIVGRKFSSKPFKLETPRQILFDDLSLDVTPPLGVTKTHRVKDMPRIVAKKVDEMLKNGKKYRGKKQPSLPLLRLRVTYPETWANAMCRRFGTKYIGEVANPMDMIAVKEFKPKCARKEFKVGVTTYGKVEKTTTLEEIVNNVFEKFLLRLSYWYKLFVVFPNYQLSNFGSSAQWWLHRADWLAAFRWKSLKSERRREGSKGEGTTMAARQSSAKQSSAATSSVLMYMFIYILTRSFNSGSLAQQHRSSISCCTFWFPIW
ncbi:unnamed protein product [Enterobius vermicularis]|uniref:Mre11 DNA-binding domain-containing protein n=1 Tax=Enterobius vermicularis TaxID=51028 RepID=A0A3P6I3F0_ENTVE|nr:unnamed protein product [Enterobius vermicularis]